MTEKVTHSLTDIRKLLGTTRYLTFIKFIPERKLLVDLKPEE